MSKVFVLPITLSEVLTAAKLDTSFNGGNQFGKSEKVR